MENRIVESLKKLLPEDQVNEVASAVSEMLGEAQERLEAEYNKNLEEAYSQLSAELSQAEKTAYHGYQEAYEIINDLTNRLEVQKAEFENTLEEGYEEAYQMLLSERNSKGKVEVDLYEEYDSKLAEMKNYIVEKVDQFLQLKGGEIYEQARYDLMNDPRIVEHKVALDKIINITSNYLSDEEKAFATSSKLDEATKRIDELKGQLRLLEARNIRLSTDNTRLNESVRRTAPVLTESRKVTVDNKKARLVTEQKERAAKVKSASGRGHIDTDNVQVIAEYNGGGGEVNELLILSGVRKNKN
jgi:HD-GYP domain-containing protein (c-di-GMP phosphodiesterase class II)